MSAGNGKATKFGPVPLVIGLIGTRRALSETESKSLLDQVRFLLTELAERFPRPRLSSQAEDADHETTSPANQKKDFSHTPIVLVTALSSAIEQGAVNLALDLCGIDGVEVLVPMPMKDADSYDQVLKQDGLAGDFDKLIQRLKNRNADRLSGGSGVEERGSVEDRWYSIPLVCDPLGTGKEPGDCRDSCLRDLRNQDGVDRQLQYLHAWAYIAHHCDLLVLLGTDVDHAAPRVDRLAYARSFRLTGKFFDSATPPPGLDEPTLERMLGQVVPEEFKLLESPLDIVETGPLYSLSAGGSPGFDFPPVPAVTGVPPSQRAQREFEAQSRERTRRIWADIEAFNREATALTSGPTAAVAAASMVETRGNLYRAGKALSAPLRRLRHFYAEADQLALKWQTRRFFWLHVLFVLALAAACAFGAYSHLALTTPVGDDVAEGHHWKNPRYLAVYALVLAAAYGAYLHAKRHKTEERHWDYRALAEATRVLFFWRVAGLPQLVSDYYLRRQKSELDWVRHAARAWSLRVSPADVPDFAAVQRHWVENQANWFPGKARENQERRIAFHELSNGFFAIGLLLAAWLIFHAFFSARAGWFNIVFLVLVSFLIPGAALLAWRWLRHLFHEVDFALWQTPLKRFRLKGTRLWKLAEWLRGPQGDKVEPSSIRLIRLFLLRLTNLVFVLAGAVAIVVCLLRIHHLSWPRWLWVHVLQLQTTELEVWIVAIAITVVIAALLHAYAWKRAYAEYARTYPAMDHLFNAALRRMDDVHAQPPELRERQLARLLRDLGRDALAENADWLRMNRERPMEVLKPA